FGGETLSLAAAKTTIFEICDKRGPEFLAFQGKKIKRGYTLIAQGLGMDYTKCSGPDRRTTLPFDPGAGDPPELKSPMQQELIKRGILWAGFHNLCYSHSDEDIDYILRAYEDVLPIVKSAVESRDIKSYLLGRPVEPVFRNSTPSKPRMA